MIIGLSGKKESGKDLVGKIIQYLIPKSNDKLIPFAEALEIWDKEEVHNSISNWQIKKFADKLKDIVCLLINCTREQLEDNNFKEKELGEEWWCYRIGKNSIYTLDHFKNKWTDEDFKVANERYLTKLTPRLLLQLLGTECGRQIIHPLIWINALMSEYNNSILGYQTTDSHIENIKLPYLDIDKRIFPNWIITNVRFTNEVKAIEDKGGVVIRIERNLESKDMHESEIALDNHPFKYTIMNDGSIEQLVEMVKSILKTINP